ncbi:MAG: hypothetical protein WAZ77_06760 [Candidatus Nitrosopolaris sp.]|jgi:hypothetical protein
MEKYSRTCDLIGFLQKGLFFTSIGALFFSFLWVTGTSYAISSISPVVKTTNLPSLKITAPHKGQQVPVSSNVTVSGISSPPVANKTHTGCTVSVLLNSIKPYQKAVATGHGGKNDYSTWKYTITSKYAALKQGQNKITSKVTCIATPTNLTKSYSVNVTGTGK